MNGVAIDANLGIALVIPLAYSEMAASKFRSWQEEQIDIIVPGLWGYEVTSALRKAVTNELISIEEAHTALAELWSLGIREVPATPELQLSSLDWADRISQRVAYDSAYLALAENLELDFWTADRSLADRAAAAGATWVHHIKMKEE